MANVSRNRNSFWKSLFKGLLYALLGVIFTVLTFAAIWGITFNFAGEETREKMLSMQEQVYDKLCDIFGSDNEEETEMLGFEGVQLSEVSGLILKDYIDFTIPYTWTIGRIEVEDAATEEAIAITGPNVVMSVSLRSVEISGEADYLKWTEEATIYELENSYPDYTFTPSEMFEGQAAVVQGTASNRNAKLYVVILPAGDKSIFVSYSFMLDDWNADLYFTTAISEMLAK